MFGLTLKQMPGKFRISQIETRLLNVSGIIDVADTELNDLAANYQAQPNNIVVLGTLESLE